MTLLLISLTWALEAFFNSIEDTIDHHFEVSIFSSIKSTFWYNWFRGRAENVRYLKETFPFYYKFMYPVIFLQNVWHFAKTFRITIVLTSQILTVSFLYISTHRWWYYVILIFAVGMIRNLTFNTFYGYSWFRIPIGKGVWLR